MIKEETKYIAYCDIKDCGKRITDDDVMEIVASRVSNAGHYIKKSLSFDTEYIIVCKECVATIINAHLEGQDK